MASAAAVFKATARDYDTDRARLIPCFADLYGWAVALVPADAQRIVDLGAGTGLLAEQVRMRFPGAHLLLIDQVEAMLQQARQRFEGDAHVSFELADYSTAPLPAEADAIVSALSIHHLPAEAKQALFARIHAALCPGGVFVNAEQVLGPTPQLEARYRAEWLQQVEALGATPQQVQQSLLRQQADLCDTVEDQLAWMRAAGFADADCWFKAGRFATFAGTRG